MAARKDIFELRSNDEVYMDIRNGKLPRSNETKQYYEKLYTKHANYLDTDFYNEFSRDFYSRAWEVIVLDYLDSLSAQEVNLIEFPNLLKIARNKIPKPDFCFELNGQRFFLEVTCATTGDPSKYPEINRPFAEINGKARSMEGCSRECRERLATRFKEKAIDLYNKGYNRYVGTDGFIIAISMAKIPFYHQPHYFPNELSCFFPCSPAMTVPIKMNRDNEELKHQIDEPYHKYQISFKKGNGKSEISTNYFGNEDHAYISAVLISYSDQIFFPANDQYDSGVTWGKARNDFYLIHNPYAKVKLPHGFFPVAREAVATIYNDGMTINTTSY